MSPNIDTSSVEYKKWFASEMAKSSIPQNRKFTPQSEFDKLTVAVDKGMSSVRSEIKRVQPGITRYIQPYQRGVTIPVPVAQGGTGLNNNNYFYLGGNSETDGTWRFAISGNDLSVQRRESGSWVEKSAFLA